MWRERLKGLVVLGIVLAGALVLVSYFSENRDKLTMGLLRIDPVSIEEKVLGVFSRLVGSASDEELREEFSAPVKEVEQKANELIEEIKNLPQAQAEVVKKQLLKTVCEPESEATDETQESQEE